VLFRQDGKISYQEFELMMRAGMDWRNTSRQYSRAVYNTLSRKMFKDVSLKLDITVVQKRKHLVRPWRKENEKRLTELISDRCLAATCCKPK